MTAVEPRPLPGGPLPIDLLNTVWWHDGIEVEWLSNKWAVSEFATTHRVDLRPADLARACAALVRARLVIGRLFTAVLSDTPPTSEIKEANDALGGACVRVDLTAEHRPQLVIAGRHSADNLAMRAVADAVNIVANQPHRLGRCEHPDCVLWFLDTSKAGRRRWCSMERCGNRAKAKRHYERVIAGSPTGHRPGGRR